ncbi:hypothetical protein [Denitromonas iodatirespirans]|uniref:Uncharacterized protein n=1 Tax=Denitromonas iodatirespirans TaxID=2795389 RepID=A0A944H811_DENI1|nr:hypothetical protein [Denitromonas iodatirespirans]MBT0961808.1 hypothetical protein [Denitromonas iodatirespirans]
MNFDEVKGKLEKVSSLIRGDDSQRNIGRLNTFVKYAVEAWMLIDPLTGAVGTGMQLLTTVLDDVLNSVKGADQQDVNTIVHQVLERHSGELAELRHLIAMLMPRASVVFDGGGAVTLRAGHRVASVTDCGGDHFLVNFDESLDFPDDFMALCSVSGAISVVHRDWIEVRLPVGTHRLASIPIKVALIRIGFP